MIVESIQKVIKVGDSIAVTIPAKDAKVAGLKAGVYVRSSHELVEPVGKPNDTYAHLDKEYEAFKRQYGQTLKNLAER